MQTLNDPNNEIAQALEQLRWRCEQMVRAGLAQPEQIARLIDELHVRLLEGLERSQGRA